MSEEASPVARVRARPARTASTVGSERAPAGAPDELKRQLAAVLAGLVRDRQRREGLAGARIAGELGLHPSDLSAILGGRLARFSCERLLVLFTRMGVDVTIGFRPSRGAGTGRIAVDERVASGST